MLRQRLHRRKRKRTYTGGAVSMDFGVPEVNATTSSQALQGTMHNQKNDAEHTTEKFSERIESMSNISSDASNLERLNRWNCALELFYKRPFFGWGPGTYSFVYAPFQSSKNLTIISTNFGDGGNAHNSRGRSVLGREARVRGKHGKDP